MATKSEIEILTLDHYLKLKSEGFEFEGQSYLFWEYMRILKELQKINPQVYFFLENVEMGEKWEKVISKAIGVKGIHINSALVSAQNRRRIYWHNIGMQPQGLFGEMESIIPQPADRGILLKDIIESEVDEKYYLSEKALKFIKSENRLEKKHSQIDGNKSITMLARQYASWNGQFVETSQPAHRSIESRIRRLTVRECGRLQTIPEQIIDKILSSGVSETQIYKMLGNGWNIETIVHILNYIK